MFSTLISEVQKWRWAELLVHGCLLGIMLVAVYLFRTEQMTILHELVLVFGLIIFLIAWFYVGSAQRTRLRTLEAHAAMIARRQFDALYEKSPAAYLTIDDDGAIKRANPAAVHLLEDTIANSTTRNFYDFVKRDAAADNSEAILRGKVSAGLTVTDFQLPIVTVKGQDRWVLVTVFAGESRDERLLAVTDITEQRAVDTAKSEFVALATHQLRTPIAAIRWNVELLLRTMKDSKTEKQDKYLTKVERNVLRMLNLINDFLSVSKLEMGTFAAEPEVVEFGEYLAGILDEFEEKVTNKQLTVHKTLEPEQMRVAIDRRLFHIISSNLLSNAVKYTPAGGSVAITARNDNGTFYFSVADTGIGIPETEQAELFKKFFRATNAKQQVTEGTGLGLYVVKQSVEILGGTLSMQSAENQGTTFIVELPGVVQ